MSIGHARLDEENSREKDGPVHSHGGGGGAVPGLFGEQPGGQYVSRGVSRLGRHKGNQRANV